MEDSSKAPYQPQDIQRISEVLKGLEDHVHKGKGRGGFQAKKRTFTLADKGGRQVDSWRLQEWDYKKPNLPTYARGLFTHHVNDKPEIVVRGYDKFFNVGEIRRTEWTNVEQNTKGPYEMSVKENGCIIFIAGLDDKTLLVTSKHSTGNPRDSAAGHAAVGESWIEKQLASIGKTKADLARTLRGMNATAVAELCDDQFEEHVLQYTPEQAGLYLHGINLNMPEFATWPSHFVNQFADEWQFKKVMYVVENDIRKVKTFLEEVGETGNYNGRDTEGFVIRCRARESPQAPWQDWFFKYKFEEPYLMYRQWRECTKAIIAGRVSKHRKHKEITDEYLLYARRQFAKDQTLGPKYMLNHGIIAMREGFLKEKGMRGSDIIRNEVQDETSDNVVENVILVPIATIGCGKTTVAVALTKLFDWGHQQNDNVVGAKGRATLFANACINSIATHPVMIADRNNHQKRERQQIITDIRTIVPEVRFVALHYVHDGGNHNDIRRATQERVLSRGDNHQTIQAGSKSPQEIIGIMDGFVKRFEPLDTERKPDSDFDFVINLDVTASSRENLNNIVTQLHSEYPKLFKMPSDEEMDEAMDFALSDYKPELKHDLGKRNYENKPRPQNGNHNSGRTTPANAMPKPLQLEYFCISLPAQRVKSILEAAFSSVDPETKQFYHQLQAERRIQTSFHVTLIHRSAQAQNSSYWKGLNDGWFKAFAELNAKQNNSPQNNSLGGTNGGVELAKSHVQLERVIWDNRLMTILVRLPDAEQNGFVTTNHFAHITIGTASDVIKPKESNDLLDHWHSGDRVGVIKDITVKGNVVILGSVVGMLRK